MQYRFFVIGTVIVVSMVGCMSQPQHPTAATRPAVVWTKDVATVAEIDEAKKKVVDQLKDPESARFGEIWALSGSNGKRSVCGYINAKNSYGGYTGNKMFMILSPDGVIMEGSEIIGRFLPGICLPRTVQ